MHTPSRESRLLGWGLWAVLISCCVAVPRAAIADDVQFNGGGGSLNWSDAIWDPTAPGVGDTVFINTLTSPLTLAVDGSPTIGNLNLGSTVGAINLASVDGSVLTFDNGGSPSALTMSGAGLLNVVINTDLAMANSLRIEYGTPPGTFQIAGDINTGGAGNTLSFGGAGHMSVSGVISGSGSLARLTTGTLSLWGDNSYTGGTTISNSALIVRHNNALGTGAVESTTSAASTSTRLLLGNGITIENDINFSGGTVSNGNKFLQTADVNGEATFAGNISSSGARLFLRNAGANTTLHFTGDIALNSNPGIVISSLGVNNAANVLYTFSGTNTVQNSSTVILIENGAIARFLTQESIFGNSDNPVQANRNTIVLSSNSSFNLVSTTLEIASGLTVHNRINTGGGTDGLYRVIRVQGNGLGTSQGWFTGDIFGVKETRFALAKGGITSLQGNLTATGTGANANWGIGSEADGSATAPATLRIVGDNRLVAANTIHFQIGNFGDPAVLELWGSNPLHDEAFTVWAGSSLMVKANDALGSGLVTLSGSGSSLVIDSANMVVPIPAIEVGNNLVVNAPGTLSVASSVTAADYSGDITLNSALGLNVASGSTLSLTGTVSGGGAVAKHGAGVVDVRGTYTSGDVTIHSGTFLVNTDSFTANMEVDGGTLGGGGTILGNVTINAGGIVAPGNSVDTLSVNGNYTLAGTYQWELGSLVSGVGGGTGDWDFITVSGIAFLDGGLVELDFGLLGGLGPDSGNAFWDIDRSWDILAASSLDGMLSLVGQTVFDNGSFSLSALGNTVMLNYTAGSTPIPEPGSLLLASLACAGLGVHRLRRRRVRAATA